MTADELKKIADELRNDQKLDIYARRFLRTREAAQRYPFCLRRLINLAYDGNAVLKVNTTVIIDTVAFEKYLETFRVVEGGYSSWLK